MIETTTETAHESLEQNTGVSDDMKQLMDKQQQQNYQRIVAWARTNFAKCREQRRSHEQQWYLNMSFYFGKQYVQQTRDATQPGTSGLMTPPVPYYVQRPTINRIRPTIRKEIAKLTASKPSAFVVPATSEDRDLFAAQAGEQIWESSYRKYHVNKVLRKAIFWTTTCGTGFIKHYWDPDAQDVDAPKANPMMGVPAPQGPSGDLKYESVSPFHIFAADLNEEELENQAFIIHAQELPIEMLRLQYPEFKLNVKVSTDSELMRKDMHPNADSSSNMYGAKKALVLECWVKPGYSQLFPNGALFTVIGDQIVQGQMNWPYSHGQYPFAKIDHLPTGRFYADSVIVDLIGLQKEYNRTRGQIIEAKNRMAKPQLAAEIGSVDPKKITSEPGQVIMYNSGFNPPTPIALQGLPSYVLQELDRILMDWADISGIHEISKGQVPPGVTAATAISFLQEQDDSNLSHTVASVEAAVEKIARMTLSYVSDYWEQERIVRVTGEGGAFDALAFKGSDLRGNNDIKVEGGSALPVSRAAKQALIMDMMKLGFIKPEDGLALLEMGGINKVYDKLQIDDKQAKREELRMSKANLGQIMQHQQDYEQKLAQDPTALVNEQGMEIDEEGIPVPPPLLVDVNTWDDHAKHIISHNNYRKSQEFENLDEASKALFDEHVNRHLAMLGLMDQGAMEAQMGPQMPGGPQDPNAMMPPEEGAPPPEGEAPPAEEPPPSEGEA